MIGIKVKVYPDSAFRKFGLSAFAFGLWSETYLDYPNSKQMPFLRSQTRRSSSEGTKGSASQMNGLYG